jgi:hypothetical protein
MMPNKGFDVLRVIRPEAGEELVRVLRLNASAFFDTSRIGIP